MKVSEHNFLVSLVNAHFGGNQTWFRNLVRTRAESDPRFQAAVQRFLRVPEMSAEALKFCEELRAPAELWLAPEFEKTLDTIVAEHVSRQRLRDRGLRARTRILFHGPPGNGKTAMAAQLAQRLKLPAFRVSITQMLDSHMGGTGKNVATVLAGLVAPVVLVLDEIDSLVMRRLGDDSAANREAQRVVNSLLTCLDTDFEGVLVMTTNRVEDLDPAFRRRLDTEILVPEPDPEAKQAVRALYCRRYGIGEETVDLADASLCNFDAIQKACEAVARAAVLKEVVP